MVRKELGLPEVYVRAADPHFAFREVCGKEKRLDRGTF